MGGGFAQVGILLVATVIGLPCFFFTLLALLDRFEQGLTNAPRAVVRPVQVVQLSAATDSEPATDEDNAPDIAVGAAVVELSHAAQLSSQVSSQVSEPFTVNPARAATG